MSEANELVELIRGRIHAEFDGECHLTDTEAHRIANFLSEAEKREWEAKRIAVNAEAYGYGHGVAAAVDVAEAEYKRHCTGSGFDSQPARSTAHRILEALKALQSEER